MIELALRMGAIMGPRSTSQARAIRMLFRVLGLWQPARDYCAQMKYKPAPRFDGGFVIPSMLSRRGVVGRMLPQPKLRSGPHAGRLLDELLGNGFALLGIGIKRIVDGFGHISVRHPENDGRFLISRSMAPALVRPEDIMTLDVDAEPCDGDTRKPFLERSIAPGVCGAVK